MDEQKTITVHIVDDDESVRQSAAFLLQTAGFNVQTYASGIDLLDRLETLSPGCVLTDVKMPGIDGLALQRELANRRRDLSVIVMTGHGDIPIAVRAMRAGAVDFIEKPYEAGALIASVKAAISQSEGKAKTLQALDRLSSLTPRERQVMEMVVNGRSNKEIANRWGISPRTVEVYRAAVLEKTMAENLAELVRLALAVEQIA